MRILLVLFSLSWFASCQSGGQKTEEMKAYTLDPIDRATQHATKRDDKGNLIEEGYFTNGQKNGAWLRYNPVHGYINEVQSYVDGKATGIKLKLDDRYRIEEQAALVKGKRHGYCASYKTGRKKQEAYYKENKLHGRLTKYHDRGINKVLSESDYVDGVQHGIFRYFDEKGNITLDYEYKNGEKVKGRIVETPKEEE